MKGVFLDTQSMAPADLDFSRLEDTLDEWVLYPRTTPDQRAKRLEETDILIVNKVVVDQALLDQAPELKLIQVAATGYNNIDMPAAQAHGVAVCNVSHYGPESVAQHAMALLLSLTNQVPQHHQQAIEGGWSASPDFCLLNPPPMALAGKTLGIIGYGAIGRTVARMAAGFGIKLLVAESLSGQPLADDVTRVPVATLLAKSDIISLHCPLSEHTDQLINQQTLAQMKPGALLINTARGGLIDETALADALRSGHLAGAGLDVLSVEPPPADHPLLQLQLPQLLITPHCAWGTRDARQTLVDEMALNIQAFLAGRSRNRIDLQQDGINRMDQRDTQ